MRSSLFALLLVAAVGAACGGVTASNDAGRPAAADGGAVMQPVRGGVLHAAHGLRALRRSDSLRRQGHLRDAQRSRVHARSPGSRHDQTTTDMVACARDASNAVCDDLLANVLPASCAIETGPAAERRGLRVTLAVPEHALREDQRRLRRLRAARGGHRRLHGRRGLHARPRLRRAEVRRPRSDGLRLQRGQPLPGQPLLQRQDQHLRDAGRRRRLLRRRQQRLRHEERRRLQRVRVAATLRDRRGHDGRRGVRPRQQHADLLRRFNTCNGLSLVPLSTSGTCPNPAGDGQQCNDDVHCLAPANCVGGLCRLSGEASCTR